MTRILFVCHGNTCRSPMAEYVMRHLVAHAGRADEILVDSAAATRNAFGWEVNPRTREVLTRHGIPCGSHRSRSMVRGDYDLYDLLIGMDKENRQDMLRIVGGRDPLHKLHLMLDWTDAPRDVDDPWFTYDYDSTYDDVLRGCQALLAQL